MKTSIRLLFLLCLLNLATSLQIFPNTAEENLEKGGSLTLICSHDAPIQWSYPSGDSNKTVAEGKNENGTYFSNLTISDAHFFDTGYFNCQSKNNASQTAKIYIYIFDEENLIALNDSLIIVHAKVHQSVVIPCKPTSPSVNVTLNTVDEEVTGLEYNPKVGYIMPNVKVTDSSFLNCAATYGDTESPPYMIQIIVNPADSEISNPFIDVSNAFNLAEGDSATLNCSITISTGDNIGLEWKYPTEEVQKKVILEDNSVHPDKNHHIVYRALTIPNLTKSDQGPYTCEVQGYPSKNETHLLHIHDKNESFLNIATHGESRELIRKAGEAQIKWVVNVTAYPKAAITWFDPDGKEIKTDPNGKYVITNKDPLTTLEMKNINIGDFGVYQLRAFNFHRTDYANFSLTVEDKPSLELRNNVEFYSLGKTYQIECGLTGYPLPRVTWSAKDCNNFPTCEGSAFRNISISQFEETNLSSKPYQMKSILNFYADRSKVLRCEASNSEGSANASSLYLVSDFENGFAIKTEEKEIVVGDDVEISCGASKYTYHSNVTWYKNGVDLAAKHLPGIRAINFTTEFSHGSTLFIPNVQKNHGGQYICRATLLNNTATTRDVEKFIPVEVKSVSIPNITATNFNKSDLWVHTNDRMEMKIQVNGTPAPTVLWYKDKKLIQVNKNESSRIVLKDRNQTLVIKYAALTDEGEYLCVASNKGGNASAKVMLWLADKPAEHEHTIFLASFCIVIVFFLMCIVWSMIRVRKEKSLRKELKETGLLNFEEGAVHSLNPELGVEDQADLLPYDKKWEFPREKLKFGKLLGCGAFGEVRKAEADGIIDENTVTTVAVKTVKRNADSLYIRALASELKIMIHLGRHLNVVNLLGACTKDLNKRELCVIVEYCKFGNLHDFLMKQRNNFINQINENGEIDFSITNNNRNYTVMNGRLNSTRSDSSVEETPIGSDGYLISKDNEPDWRSNYRGDYHNTTVKPIKTADLICWSFQIARGMDYLASRKVLHGDLAARNVLLADDNIVKICDFGLAKSMYQSENYQRQKTALLPVKWMAVESIRDRVFSTQSDVWSFGITMWELFSLSITPYPGIEQLDNLYNKLESGYRLEKPTFASKEIYGVMKDCWHSRPTLRPTFTELSERLGIMLEDGVRSHYTNLNEVYIKMNSDLSGDVDYLAMLNAPLYHSGYEEPRYVNVPLREVSDPEDDVEMKPMLKKPDEKIENTTKPVCFFNQSYIEVTNARRPTYVNTPAIS
ncbi:vascular endothelial growth factor receptor 1-like isoform X2 [Planococcus citri]|uniref:vascular endothelial growth factor receptor 1-like isoform X2 n=1 Tax=Planococcus citri TaxID=170843 RepID=UPI0031F9BA55